MDSGIRKDFYTAHLKFPDSIMDLRLCQVLSWWYNYEEDWNKCRYFMSMSGHMHDLKEEREFFIKRSKNKKFIYILTFILGSFVGYGIKFILHRFLYF